MSNIFVAVPSIGTCDIRFALSLASLKKPPGTAIASSPRSVPNIARNALFDQAVRFGYRYVFFLDDDMLPHPETLSSLVSVLESDPSFAAVAPLAFRRHPPFYPCVFTKSGDSYEPLRDLDGPPIAVDAIHFGATLVRVDALLKVPPPRFEFGRSGESVLGEDIVLSEKIRSLGMKLVCHREVEVLHIGVPSLVGRDAYEETLRKSEQKEDKSRIIIP